MKLKPGLLRMPLLLFLITVFTSNAQLPLNASSIFDKRFLEINNYPSKTLAFSDFKDKQLIILYFWAHGCIPCWQSFSKISNLQKKFDGSVQIIAVNLEGLDTTLKFVQKRKSLKLPNVPQIMNGYFLDSFFNQRNNPGAVWMNNRGQVLHITEGFYINDTVINEYLNGSKITSVSESRAWKNLPSLLDSNYSSTIPYFSYIGKCIDAGRVRLSETNVSISTGDCKSFLDLYHIAFNEDYRDLTKGFSRIGRTVLIGKAADIPFRSAHWTTYSNWTDNHSYYYQLKVPDEMKERRFEFMRADLNRFFNLEAHVEKRAIVTCVLKRIGNKDLLRSKGEDKESNFGFNSFFTTKIDTIATFYNTLFEGVSDRIRYAVEEVMKIPFKDETDYAGIVDFEMKMNVLDHPTLESFNEQLRRYGLFISKEKRNLSVLVISDNTYPEHLKSQSRKLKKES